MSGRHRLGRWERTRGAMAWRGRRAAAPAPHEPATLGDEWRREAGPCRLLPEAVRQARRERQRHRPVNPWGPPRKVEAQRRWWEAEMAPLRIPPYVQ